MASETTTTTLTELVKSQVHAASAMYFAERPGVSAFVAKKDISGEATLVAEFPVLDKISAGAIAEASDYTTNSALDSTGSVAVTVSEHAVKSTITDLTLGATVEDVISPSAAVQARATGESGLLGQAFGEALQRLQDQDICALFSGFNSSTGSNSGPLTTTLLIAGITQLNIDNIPTDRRVAVLHAKQWQALLPSFDDAAVAGAQGQQIMNTGAVGVLYGAIVFETNNVATATVSASTVYAGAIMHPTAIAIAVKGAMPQISTERDESLRATEVVGVGVWGEAEYRGGATTSGRGGAGIYFYSNTTN